MTRPRMMWAKTGVSDADWHRRWPRDATSRGLTSVRMGDAQGAAGACGWLIRASRSEEEVRVRSADRVVESFRRSPRAAGHSERTRRELRSALEAADLLDGLDGLTVRELDDDEVLLLQADGREVDTWRQDYHYEERISAAVTLPGVSGSASCREGAPFVQSHRTAGAPPLPARTVGRDGRDRRRDRPRTPRHADDGAPRMGWLAEILVSSTSREAEPSVGVRPRGAGPPA